MHPQVPLMLASPIPHLLDEGTAITTDEVGCGHAHPSLPYIVISVLSSFLFPVILRNNCCLYVLCLHF